MPIEQSRLYNLINAAEGIQNIYLSTCDQVEKLVTKYLPAMTPEDQSMFISLVHAPEYIIVTESQLILQERIRYNYTWRRNQSEARRRARQAENNTRPLSHRRKWELEGLIPASVLANAPNRVDPKFAREYQEYIKSNPQFQDLADPPATSVPVPSVPVPDTPMPHYDNEHTLQSTASMLDQDDQALDDAMSVGLDEDDPSVA